MNREDALREIQKMHETKTVLQESVIGWYCFYSYKLPKMHPERSLTDLIKTIDLWMELTDRGGAPEFPYEYKCGIDLTSVKLDNRKKGNISFPIGFILLLIGAICIFVKFTLGIALLIISLLILYIGYKFEGGSKNPELYARELTRVIKWARN